MAGGVVQQARAAAQRGRPGVLVDRGAAQAPRRPRAEPRRGRQGLREARAGRLRAVSKARAATLRRRRPGRARRRRRDDAGRRSAACSASPRPTPSCVRSRASSSCRPSSSDTEDKIAAARRYYNAVVQRYNTRLQTLPTSLDRPAAWASRRASTTASRTRPIASPSACSCAACDAPGADPRQPPADGDRAARLRLLVAALVFGVAGLYEPGHRRLVRHRGDRLRRLRLLQLRARSSPRPPGAHPVTKAEQPELYRAVENAAIGAGLTTTPDVYLIDDVAPNAFAAGRNAGARLRRGDDRPAAAARQARARGRDGPRDRPRAQPRRAADEPRGRAGRRDRAGLRHAHARHALRRRRAGARAASARSARSSASRR